ncbi:ATP-dependent nuclease subunit B [Candidatus Rhodobacter oscarellae]|uniref:ATP-dependent nuclease subunit B n=1 Tax=Candidatus Rhodobacter oscarellae TaxID=1675527 RepID=A0A0J9EB60_9RHOB|nr:double-strand break repair protein AddB [Candidatus Rhodobacter lobularis]KMW58919.1 ATP-dependent nuclease subunit B [Candidatus Rhodobacter lobularis]
MFEPTDTPRVFGVPPGEDFPAALLKGLRDRMVGLPPEAWPDVEIYVNTRRMQRRLKALFDAGGATLLPRIRLITDFARDVRFPDIPPMVPALRRKLELAQLVSKLIEREPDLAPRTAIYDLADSLSALMDEMQSEGVDVGVLERLDIAEVSGHWQRSLKFISLIQPLFDDEAPTPETRQRMVIKAVKARWSAAPPSHPVIVAGSTGSRGSTAELMRAVCDLSQGALVLPGFDFDMPHSAWSQLDSAITGEDHPQFRFGKLARSIGIDPRAIGCWSGEDVSTPRSKLVSLALRPAPVTDQWLVEGPKLEHLDAATADVSLIEAPSARIEALSIALALRDAHERGKTAALITPDRTLTRQVTAALDRWRIVPDDSAGQPLALSPPGRLLRQVSSLIQRKVTGDTFLALLKHPLVATGDGSRGGHLLQTREFELWLRRRGPAYITRRDLEAWAAGGDEDRTNWVAWIGGVLDALQQPDGSSLDARLDHHIATTERLCAGPGAMGSGALWLEAAGVAALDLVESLRSEAGYGGTLDADEYTALFRGVLNQGEVRSAILAHPDLMIWGTLEARVQGADLVILGGLNEGTWPQPARPDPWLNRVLRHQAGMLLPEREIGLSAHDFQQAVCGQRVIISRSIRDAEAQTVPSRWLNRLMNLLSGLGDTGKSALKGMQDRGSEWVRLAENLGTPTQHAVAPAPRPSPRPPVEDRPSEISITEVQRLIRDPYAVYARRILGLRPLDPLRQSPDAAMRGTVLHEVFERFISAPLSGSLADDRVALLSIAGAVLEKRVGWPAARRLWMARVAGLADWFVAGEYQRRTQRDPIALEKDGHFDLADIGMRLYGKIDRIDRGASGDLAAYDYKTGQIPTAKVQEHFDKQLLLSALIAERGEIMDVPRGPVCEVGYIGLGTSPKFDPVEANSGDLDTVLIGLRRLLAAFQDRSRGYSSRRAVNRQSVQGDYDHLARFGEWDESHPPQNEDVG